MYGYNYGGYGNYPSSYYNQATAQGYGGLGQAAIPAHLAGLFGTSTSNAYAPYGNGNTSNDAPVYGGQGQTWLQLAGYVPSTQVSQQFSQGTAMNDSYTSSYTSNAMSSQFGTFSNAGYGSTPAPPPNTFKQSAPKGPGGLPPVNFSQPPANNQAPYKTSQYKGVSATGSNSNTFSNYDAAVYAAASSYLQSKAAGTANVWMSKKPNGTQNSAGQCSQRRYGNRTGVERDSQQFYCEICKISCAGNLTYKDHLQGQRHKKKEASAKNDNGPNLSKNKISLPCELCNVMCTGLDTFNAHVNGTRHQKTLALHKKLGKPIPHIEPAVILPSETGGTMSAPGAAGAPIPTVGNTGIMKRVIGIHKVNFVGGTTLTTSGKLAMSSSTTAKPIGPSVPGANVAVVDASSNVFKKQCESLQALIVAEQNVQPVGEEYVEAHRDGSGKLLQYICKLCDCKFSDPNAKDIHLKGRRHRLQYKIKVDSSLMVERKQPPRNRNARDNRRCFAEDVRPTGFGAPLDFAPSFCHPPMWFATGRGYEGRRFDTVDDRHVQAKHVELCPTLEELANTESLVSGVEAALKNVSDFFHERDHPMNVEKSEGAAEDGKFEDRLLKGVMRVGMLAKNLMMKGDSQTELVVLCSIVPTQSLLMEIVQLLPEFYQKGDYLLTITEDSANAALIVHRTDCDVGCRVQLTSRIFREEASGEGATTAPIPDDSLPKNCCLDALAQLRRFKWFQARCAFLQSCQTTLRILRDLRKRLDGWLYLNDWTCELLVEKVLDSSVAPMSAGEALRRVFEAIASGILLPGGVRLQDPCEKEYVDVLSELSALQRESITVAAQNALRLMAFRQLHKILNMERLSDGRSDRKRSIETSNGVGTDEKKFKTEEAVTEEMKMEMKVKVEVPAPEEINMSI